MTQPTGGNPIAPCSFTVHAFLALAGRLDHRAVGEVVLDIRGV